MKRGEGSKGRGKNIKPGTGKVFRRGEGIDVNFGKPLGEQDGYADRKKGSAGQKKDFDFENNQNDGQQGGNQTQIPDIISGLSNIFGSSSSNAKPGQTTASTGSKLKKILIIAAVVIIGYIIFTTVFSKSCQNNDAASYNENENAVLADSGNSGVPLNTAVSLSARNKRTIIKGGGSDIFTIMVYMCGTDLESEYGMATSDLNEILYATISDKVNIIVETGGTRSWQNSVISNNTNQRYQCTNDGLKLLQDNLGKRAMTDPATLTDFIRYCKNNFSANRYALIFWDHGGGSINGYGYDQNVPNTSMTLHKINTALKNAGCQFDFVGFDACLMATLETAVMLNNYSDYMIASEETEPGTGWYYTNWITALSKNTSMSTLDIGKILIDDYIKTSYNNSPNDKTTLSIVDLAELSGTVPSVFRTFASSTGKLINSDNYKTVADARGNTREFGQSARIDQIDLIHLAQNIGTAESKKLVEVLKECIKYNRTSRSISNANGLSIYFPYDRLSGLGTMLSTYEKIGIDKEYGECLKSFANLEAGGQIVTSGTTDPFGSLLDSFLGSNTGTDLISGLLGSFIQGGDFSSFTGGALDGTAGWLDTNKLISSADYYEKHYLDSKNIIITEKDGGYVLSLPDSDWDLIQNINLNVFYDDGGGYIDLGLDNVYEFDSDGDLKIVFDQTWLAINGHIVSYYFLTEDRNGDEYTITGRVPALLNGQLVDIILVFDDKTPYGVVAGARKIYSGETQTVAKGLIAIEDGDVIDFLCDYYTYDEKYLASYYLGEKFVVEGDLEISNINIGENNCKVTYKLFDIYNNTYWTPAVDY